MTFDFWVLFPSTTLLILRGRFRLKKFGFPLRGTLPKLLPFSLTADINSLKPILQMKNITQEILNFMNLKLLRATLGASDLSLSRKSYKIHRKVSKSAITTTTTVNDNVFIETEFFRRNTPSKQLELNEVIILMIFWIARRVFVLFLCASECINYFLAPCLFD